MICLVYYKFCQIYAIIEKKKNCAFCDSHVFFFIPEDFSTIIDMQ